MSQDVFKAPKAKRKHGNNHKRDSERYSPKKRQRTKDDFFTFCNIVLEYTQYDTLKQEELRRCNNTSPLDSTGSTADSFTSESTSSSISESEHDDKPLDATPRMVSSMLGHDEDSNSGFTTSPKVERVERDEELDNSRDSLHDHIRNSGVESDDSAMERPSDESGDDSWELVTCYCMKPFSGRPMIECSECLTWIHLSCAKIRKSNIPDDFVCQKCRESKFTMRKSSRIRSEKKMINA